MVVLAGYGASVTRIALVPAGGRKAKVMEPSDVRPLSGLRMNEKGVVIALKGGRRFINRLTGMGLNVGSRVDVVQSGDGHQGPTLVATGETRLAIGHGMAEKIMVSVDPARSRK